MTTFCPNVPFSMKEKKVLPVLGQFAIMKEIN